MKYTSIPSAQTVIYHCKSRGIKDIIISPGSRNAPLTIGFTEDDFFNCYSIVDERCAAFFALGISQQIRQAVALVCTSGSALLNYYPAVSEAFYSDIPLVVISADRPQYKIDIGDGQTIRQEHVFENHIGYSANLKLDPKFDRETAKVGSLSPEEVQEFNEAEINAALLIATEQKAPVHINIPFEEPLYDTLKVPPVIPGVVVSANSKENTPGDLADFLELWNSSYKKMILVGTHPPKAIAQPILENLGNDKSVLVFTETTSNLHHPNFFPSIDSIIAPIEMMEDKDEHFRDLQPEILLTFGGMIVSKKIKAFLRKYPPKYHWHVDAKKAYDTFFCLSRHFKMDASAFFSKFLKDAKSNQSDYYQQWDARRSAYLARRELYLSEIPFSDLLAFSIIFKSIPISYQIQLANSSTVRYAQLFNMHPSLTVFSNRGTSGIDGSTSTAIGASLYSSSPTLLLTGDLSFFYDSNGLWNNYMRPDFRIIVINNGGGGIFRILPGKADTEKFETYFETVQNLCIERLCSFYDLEYSSAEDTEDLMRELPQFYQDSKRPKLLEIRTPRTINDNILLNYFDFIS
ncbi:MAG: 2-succinyl-5-enolpyruvyl-6-hydroxy-3-cyclohexene-1-carboxylic-acid synthase [Eudoraea sp.]|nr:2-succinyl-5-enolpyruvyl-6-hydroxy-3-cyclohexene-1-carboxylic-acid synthase [Eudoraea sp.]